MKTIHTVVYNPEELKKQFPEAFEKALEKWYNMSMAFETYYQEEGIYDALWNFLKETLPINLTDLALDYGCPIRSYVSFYWNNDDEGRGYEEMDYPRSRTWVWNNIIIPGAKAAQRKYGKRTHNVDYESRYLLVLSTPEWEVTKAFVDLVLKEHLDLDTAVRDIPEEIATLVYNEYAYQASEEALLNSPTLWTEGGEFYDWE